MVSDIRTGRFHHIDDALLYAEETELERTVGQVI